MKVKEKTTLTFPIKGTRWCSQSENISISFTITISSWSSSKIASFRTSAKDKSYFQIISTIMWTIFLCYVTSTVKFSKIYQLLSFTEFENQPLQYCIGLSSHFYWKTNTFYFFSCTQSTLISVFISGYFSLWYAINSRDTESAN